MSTSDAFHDILGAGRDQLDGYKPYIEILDSVSNLATSLAQDQQPSRTQSQYDMLLPPLSYSEVPASFRDYLNPDDISSLSVTFTSEERPKPALPLLSTSLEVVAGNRTLHIGRDSESPLEHDSDAKDCIVIMGSGTEPTIEYIDQVSPSDITYLLLLGAGHTPDDLRTRDLSETNILAPESLATLQEVISSRAARLYAARSYELPTAAIDITIDDSATDTSLPTDTTIHFHDVPLGARVDTSSGLRVELIEESLVVPHPDKGDLVAARDRIRELLSPLEDSEEGIEILTRPAVLEQETDLA